MAGKVQFACDIYWNAHTLCQVANSLWLVNR